MSWDFALSIVPGFHHTIFAPYFVCGAIYSGTAGIVTVMYVLRKTMHLERYIREIHVDNLGKLLIALSMVWTFINVLEVFTGWYSGTSYEIESLKFKMFGFYAPLFWEMILFCAVVPMLIWFNRIRLNWTAMFWISILINIGVLVWPDQVAVRSAHDAFADDGSLKDAARHEAVERHGSELTGLLAKLKGESN